MPKDEFDFEDPLELNGMAILSSEDTTNDMAECFTEEFMRLGYDHRRILAMFANPHYLGPNLAFQQRGEVFIRDLIAGVFARWGKQAPWLDPDRGPEPPERGSVLYTTIPALEAPPLSSQDNPLTDPTGAPIPRFEI
jgi:hypothetical protein